MIVLEKIRRGFKWIRFNFVAWDESPTVLLMTREQRSVYLDLLLYQVKTGFIPANHEEICKIVFRKEFATEYFTKTLWPGMSCKFLTAPEDSTKIYNHEMLEMITQANNPATRCLVKDKVLSRSGFDFFAAWKAYPKREDPSEGREEGLLNCEKYITTQEDYDMFMAAIDVYAKKRAKKGRLGKKTTLSFSRFTISAWRDHVPPEMLETSSKASNGPVVESLSDTSTSGQVSDSKSTEAKPERMERMKQVAWTPPIGSGHPDFKLRPALELVPKEKETEDKTDEEKTETKNDPWKVNIPVLEWGGK